LSEVFSGFGGTSGVGHRPCVIVVDFINGFTDPSTELYTDMHDEIAYTARLLEIARDQSIPIVFTTVVYEPHYLDGAHFIEKVPALKILLRGTNWIDVDDRLARRPEREPLVEKKFASAFFGTSLQSMLVAFGIDTVIVTGCTTSGCVRATVVDALQHGYRVLVSREVLGDRSASSHQANLYDIQSKYGDVVGLDDVCRYILEPKR